jgi:hypothetical protein
MTEANTKKAARTWAVAVYKEASVSMDVWEPHKYPSPWRLIIPIAVRRRGGVVEVVDAVWTQCHSPRASPVTMTDCVVYFPPDVDAIVYLKERLNFWREVDVRCDSGDADFCNRLRRIAEDLWKRVKQPLSPEEVAAALARLW